MRFFNGEIVVVTGSSQGIGKACALAAAREGAGGVIVNGRRAAETSAAAEEVASLRCPAYPYVADLTEPGNPAKLIAFAEEKFGKLDVLVNNIGVSDRSDIFSLTYEELDRMMAINVKPTVFATQAAINLFLRLGIEGSVINNGSMNGYVGQANLVAYSMTKGAIATFTKTVGHDMAVRHADAFKTDKPIPWIRVNGVSTPWTNSEGETKYKRQETPDAPDDWYLNPPLSGVPRGRMTSVEEVANFFLYLASKHCSHINGQQLPVEQFNLAGPPNRAL